MSCPSSPPSTPTRFRWAAATLAASLLLPGAARGYDGAGAGTPGDPYQIRTALQLQEISSALDAHYVLAGDVDATGTAAWNAGQGFAPIGDESRPFTGSLDGRRHRIRGLRIDRFGSITTHIALFGHVGASAGVCDVTVEGAVVNGCDHVAVLAGRNSGRISGCQVSGHVNGSGSFGGLVGTNTASGVVSRCSAAVDLGVVWVGNHLGGLVGINHGRIDNCFATGTVQGHENAGGLVGVSNGGTIRDSYATGHVTGSFAGASASYPRGAGGLVGEHQGGATVIGCFAAGRVDGPGGLYVGAIVGSCLEGATLDNVYCLQTPGVPVVGVGSVLPDAGTIGWKAVTTIDQAFFLTPGAPLGGWDFRETWTFDRSPSESPYPHLRASGGGHPGDDGLEPGPRGIGYMPVSTDPMSDVGMPPSGIRSCFIHRVILTGH